MPQTRAEKPEDGPVDTEHSQLKQLHKRFEVRLGAALDALAYPVARADRARALAAATGVDVSEATAFLLGHALPDHSQLLALCNVVQREPGYFFDEHLTYVPPGTTLVKSLGAGEDLVVRLPTDEVSARGTKGGLVYIRTKVAMGFGIGAGEYLIAVKPGSTLKATSQRLYLVSDDQGYSVRRCVEVTAGRAVFHADGPGDVPLIVSTAAGKADPNIAVCQIVASLLCGSSLHKR